MKLTNEELVMQFQKGYVKALDELVELNKGLVKFYAYKYGKYVGKILSHEDLEQIGWVAFIRCAKSYPFSDQYTNNNFSPYASAAIVKDILNEINRMERNKTHKKYKSGEDVCVESLNEIIPGTDSLTRQEIIEDDSSEFAYLEIEHKLFIEQLREDLFELIYTVLGHNYSSQIIIEYYGLIDQPITQCELAKKYDRTIDGIRYIIFEGIKTMRNSKQGKAFMIKYKDECIRGLEDKKNSLNEFQKPEKLVCVLESIDNLMNDIISKYGGGDE